MATVTEMKDHFETYVPKESGNRPRKRYQDCEHRTRYCQLFSVCKNARGCFLYCTRQWCSIVCFSRWRGCMWKPHNACIRIQVPQLQYTISLSRPLRSPVALPSPVTLWNERKWCHAEMLVYQLDSRVNDRFHYREQPLSLGGNPSNSIHNLPEPSEPSEETLWDCRIAGKIQKIQRR